MRSGTSKYGRFDVELFHYANSVHIGKQSKKHNASIDRSKKLLKTIHEKTCRNITQMYTYKPDTPLPSYTH